MSRNIRFIRNLEIEEVFSIKIIYTVNNHIAKFLIFCQVFKKRNSGVIAMKLICIQRFVPTEKKQTFNLYSKLIFTVSSSAIKNVNFEKNSKI